MFSEKMPAKLQNNRRLVHFTFFHEVISRDPGWRVNDVQKIGHLLVVQHLWDAKGDWTSLQFPRFRRILLGIFFKPWPAPCSSPGPCRRGRRPARSKQCWVLDIQRPSNSIDSQWARRSSCTPCRTPCRTPPPALPSRG